MSTIVFTGGGTLGHLFAGLAAAEALREIEPEARISFAGKGLPGEAASLNSGPPGKFSREPASTAHRPLVQKRLPDE